MAPLLTERCRSYSWCCVNLLSTVLGTSCGWANGAGDTKWLHSSLPRDEARMCMKLGLPGAQINLRCLSRGTAELPPMQGAPMPGTCCRMTSGSGWAPAVLQCLSTMENQSCHPAGCSHPNAVQGPECCSAAAQQQAFIPFCDAQHNLSHQGRHFSLSDLRLRRRLTPEPAEHTRWAATPARTELLQPLLLTRGSSKGRMCPASPPALHPSKCTLILPLLSLRVLLSYKGRTYSQLLLAKNL